MVTPSSEASMKSSAGPASRLQSAREEMGLNKKQAAEQLGVGYSTYRGWERGRAEPEVGIDSVIRHLKTGDTIASGQRHHDDRRDPIYPAVASAGGGSFEMADEPAGYIEGEEALSRPGREVFWVPIRGDSMEGTLPKGGLVPVQRFDPTWTELREDDVYLFRLEGAIQIKRLQRRPGARIRVVSDNDNYDDFNIALDNGVDFEILGRVLV